MRFWLPFYDFVVKLGIFRFTFVNIMFSNVNFIIMDDAVEIQYVQFYPKVGTLFRINSVPESGL
jgi:hypothetical protein